MSLVFIFEGIGVGLIIWGARKLTLAFRNDDIDSKVKGVPFLVVGGLLYGVLTILDVFGVL